MIRKRQSEFVRQANAAMREAAETVLDRARRHNTPIIVWRDGKVVHLDPWTQEPVTEPDAPTNNPTDR